MDSTIIEISGLTRRFAENTAVNQLSLTVLAGEVFGFLGHNGAGKTTTVRLLNGVLEPHSGSIRVLGLDPIADGPALRARTGVLTESASLDGRLTARENLLIFADLFGVPKIHRQSRVDELLDFFELTAHARSQVAGFSTGMRQRLAIARTLLHDPEILFLDEPTAGLDPLAAHQTTGLISSLAREQGRTVFLCTHNLVEAQKICDRVAVLEHGRLVALGTPNELAQQYIRRLDLDIETAEDQIEQALQILSASDLGTGGLPRRANNHITLTAAGREAIPNLVALLVNNGIRVYRIAAHEPNLEEVYFALHGEKEFPQ